MNIKNKRWNPKRKNDNVGQKRREKYEFSVCDAFFRGILGECEKDEKTKNPKNFMRKKNTKGSRGEGRENTREKIYLKNEIEKCEKKKC